MYKRTLKYMWYYGNKYKKLDNYILFTLGEGGAGESESEKHRQQKYKQFT